MMIHNCIVTLSSAVEWVGRDDVSDAPLSAVRLHRLLAKHPPAASAPAVQLGCRHAPSVSICWNQRASWPLRV